MKGELLKFIFKTSFHIVLEVLAGVTVRGWRVIVARDQEGKIMTVTITREKP
jgi:hypothetical protein